MYKIGVIGNGPERFVFKDRVLRSIERTIDLLVYQYGDVVFNVKAAIGVGLWVAETCFVQERKYHLFLPFRLDKTSEHWYEAQSKILAEAFNRAYSLTICHPDDTVDEHTYQRLIDESNFVVCFWAGNKSGCTADAIRYGLENNKIMLDGLNELKLLTNRDLRK